jgi:ParB-like chromosome segregation protein Spo0J
LRQESKELSGKHITRVTEIDVATVKRNKTLASCVDKRAIERCKETIEKLGVLHTPIVGTVGGDNHFVLSGQCELTVLHELGVKKMDAIKVEVSDDEGAMAKFALLLISMRSAPDALSEGFLLNEAITAGTPRSELQTMLGKSAAWVSNRLSLVTKLDSSVYEMVGGGLLDARSAQEIARLPSDVQFSFAERAIREGLPKSTIEKLVAGYNADGCPEEVKAQILCEPVSALKRMKDNRRAVEAKFSGGKKEYQPPEDIEGCLKATKLHMSILCRLIYNKSPYDIQTYKTILKELESDISALLTILNRLIYPGKKEDKNAG